MIKTVIFDLGNVLLPFDLSRLTTRLAAHSSLPPEEIIHGLWNQTLAHEFETGQMTAEEYFDFVQGSCRLQNLSLAEFVEIFNDIFKEDEDVWKVTRALKRQFQLGVISNTNPIHAQHIRENYPAMDVFEQVWFSNEHGARKPDPALYRRAIDHFGHEPERMIFVDDLIENVASARSLGIKAIHYQGANHLKEELKNYDVFIDENDQKSNSFEESLEL